MDVQNVGNPVAPVGSALTKEQLDAIIEEMARYEVNLEDDPTLPHLGTRYLQTVVSRCRAYQNRVQYYLQIVKLHEKKIRLDLRQRELDLEFKMREKLADDPIVRKQASIEDRRALASMMFADEHRILSDLRVELLDIEETVKLIRSKYDQLKQTSNDIRMQRTLIKDDKEAQLLGGDGYVKPQASQNRTIADGMPAAVRPGKVEPSDLLDPEKRPEDMPEPIDDTHAGMMADFLNSNPVKLPVWHCETCGESVMLKQGEPMVCSKKHRAVCAVCGDQQLFSTSGPFDSKHGGTETRMVGPEDDAKAAPPELDVPVAKSMMTYEDLLSD